MIPFAVAALATGIADLIAGFSGRPQGFLRCLGGWIAGVGTTLGVADGLGFELEATLLLGGIVAILLPIWFGFRATREIGVGRGAFGFWLVFLAFGCLIATGSKWPSDIDGHLANWIDDVPLAGFDGRTERVVLCAALVAFLLATANGVVRLVLAMSSEGTPTDKRTRADVRRPPVEEETLRGGRMIGPLERLLIFGFVAAGQVTAAIVVVSAKALLRFPEISRESQEGRPQEIHRLNEYLVVGSLASWTLAFLAGGVFRATG